MADIPEDNLADAQEEHIPTYEELVKEEPEREINLQEIPKTIEDEENISRTKTDAQAILQALTPQFKDKELNEVLQPIMVSRVFPDNMLDSCKMTVLSRLLKFSPTDNSIDVWGIISATHVAHSIGFEGRAIADRLEIAGAVQEQELEKLSKDLGL
jgi:hypothetical protein